MENINVNVKNSRISKITLDAAPFGGNGKVTYTNLTYDAATVFGSIMIQDEIEDAGMANVTINDRYSGRKSPQEIIKSYPSKRPGI